MGWYGLLQLRWCFFFILGFVYSLRHRRVFGRVNRARGVVWSLELVSLTPCARCDQRRFIPALYMR